MSHSALHRTTLLAALVLSPLACSHEQRRGEAGVGCAVASCCLGWLWMGTCVAAREPFCGCSCKQPPLPYATREECLADHPPRRQP